MKKLVRKVLRIVLIATVVSITLFALLTPSPALAATRYEYHTTGPDIESDVRGNLWKAQTFTPSVAHRITSVKLLIRRVLLPGTITVGIRETDVDGHPTGADLCFGTTDGDTLPTSWPGEWREITLGAGYNLDADTKYAIVARAPTGDGSNKVIWQCDLNGTYDGGNYEYSGNSGTSWTADTDKDLLFEEWGEVGPPTVTTNAATYVAQTTARLNSTVISDGGEACDVRFGYDDITQAVFANYEWITDWVLDEYETGEHPFVDIEGLTPSDEYFFRAQIKNSEGTLVTGDPELTLDTEAGFAVPSNLKAYPRSTTVGLTWTKGVGAARTMIRYSEVDYPANQTEGTLSYLGPLASHTITGLTAGHTYYIVAISSDDGNYGDTVEVMATTTAGAVAEDEPDDPAMPPTWFQSPNYTGLSGLPLYAQMNDLFDSFELPRASGWFFSAILGCVVIGAVVFAISRHPTPAVIALAVSLAIASFIKLLPLHMMAFSVVFIIGVWQLGRER